VTLITLVCILNTCLGLGAGLALFSGLIHANTLEFSVLNEDISILMAMTPTLVLCRDNYWKQQAEKDTGQVSTNPHILAARIIARGGPITVQDVNSVLEANGKDPITENELEELKALFFDEYKLPLEGQQQQTFNSQFPVSCPKGKGEYGIYIYTNMVSMVAYVGSSTVLHERLRHYWKKFGNLVNLRKILMDIRVTGLSHFTLRVCCFPVHLREVRLMLALEQYYMLLLNPQNNTIYVADGSPGGQKVAELNREKHSRSSYLYLAEGMVLLYTFSGSFQGPNSMRVLLSMGKETLTHLLGTNGLYLGKFILAKDLHSPNDTPTMTLEQAIQAVKAAQKESLQRASNTPRTPVIITQVSKGLVVEKVSLAQTCTYIKEQGFWINQSKLNKLIHTGDMYEGYTFKKGTPIVKKKTTSTKKKLL